MTLESDVLLINVKQAYLSVELSLDAASETDMPQTQAHRNAAISTPLGDDVLLLKSLSVTEELGRLFQFEVELLSENQGVSFADIVGQNATIRLTLPAGGTRYFNGYVNRFVQAPRQGRLACYQATLVPWLWFLTRVADCHIFQELSAPQIIEQVFRGRGFTDFKNSLSESYRTREYCVQYRESDFNFVSRLMEEEGIYYFFEHENGKHTLVLADSKSAHTVFPGYERILHRELDEAGLGEEYLFDWRVEQQVQPGIVCLHAFDFQKPAASLTVKANVIRQHAVPHFEVFDYPGAYVEYADGETCARCRIEELQVQHERAQAQSVARGTCAGFLITMEGHPREDQNREYLITSVSCRVTNDPYGSERQIDAAEFFSCRLTALNSDTPFRPARLTPRPVVSGPQTGLVVGPKGEEIYTDKYGRVKVQFHWDRYGKGDENSSCWVRVSQAWAGKGWGAVSIPRVGQEVVVDFLEGDPDRPIITGRVYNASSHVPYPLPDHKTMTSFKSNSTVGGHGFNEIRFEDKKGSEQLFVHAEKDLELRIKNDVKEWIGNERHLILKKDQFESIEGSTHYVIKQDALSKVEGDCGQTVQGDHLVKVAGKDHLTVGGDQFVKINGDANLKHGKNFNQEVGQKLSLKSGMDLHGKAGMNLALEAGMQMHLKAGATLIIEGLAQLSLKCGPSFVDIGPSGVAISGPMVMINSGGAAGSGNGCSPTAPAAAELPDPPKAPKEAAKADPGEKDEPPPAPTPPQPHPYHSSVKVQQEVAQGGAPPATVDYSSAARALKAAAEDGTPFCEECARAAEEEAAKTANWIEIELVGEDGKPIPDEPYRITLPDGTVEEGTLDDNGVARVEGFEPGDCQVTFPELDEDAWGQL